MKNNKKPKKIRPAFKIFGGKYYLSDWIIDLFPENYTGMDYVEPFCGAASVFLNKTPSNENHIEVINDIDPGVFNISCALRDESKAFIKMLKKTKYSEVVFKKALKQKDGPFESYMDHAINDFILRRMSRSGMKTVFGWSDRERGGQPGDLNAWKTIISDTLPIIAERLKSTRIFNKSGVEIINAFDSENTLFYVDPPYDPDSRVSKDVYGFEMTPEDHIRLSDELKRCKGKVIVSGYASPLYNRLYEGWRCEKKKIANHSSQQKKKKYKTECCWMNF